jgi:hypothetical protein
LDTIFKDVNAACQPKATQARFAALEARKTYWPVQFSLLFLFYSPKKVGDYQIFNSPKSMVDKPSNLPWKRGDGTYRRTKGIIQRRREQAQRP